MIIEIKNPNTPSIKIPIAETFVTVSNSFLEGFLRTCQTRLHLTIKDFADIKNSFTMIYLENKSF